MKRLKQCLLFPKTNCGCGLVTLALALAWPAHGADPVLIGQWPGWPRGPACGVAVSGNYAYVADEDAGLQVIDVSNPANPQRVGGYDTSGYANGVAVSGNYAYVADVRCGLAGDRREQSGQPAAGGRLRHQRVCLWRGGERELRLRGGLRLRACR